MELPEPMTSSCGGSSAAAQPYKMPPLLIDDLKVN